jgi:hypothetical protein
MRITFTVIMHFELSEAFAKYTSTEFGDHRKETPAFRIDLQSSRVGHLDASCQVAGGHETTEGLDYSKLIDRSLCEEMHCPQT